MKRPPSQFNKLPSIDASGNRFTLALVDYLKEICAAIESVQLSASATPYTADEVTLTLTGSQFSVKAGGIGPTQLASTAVTPGSYTFTSLTVDADGRITAASNGTESNGFSTIAVSGQSNVVADSATDTLTLAAGSNITITTNATTDTVTIAATGGVSDGDKVDITVSGSGATWTIDNDVVTYAKMQNVSAASKLLGRGDSGSGDPQEISVGDGLEIVGTTLQAIGGFSGGIFFFGDGVDGSVTLDGTNTFSWASKSGNTYTLIDTVMANNMTIDAGVTLIPAGFPIYVSGTLTNNGHISGDGTGAVVGHGGGNQSGGNGAWSAGAQVYGTGTNGAGSTGGAGSAGTTNSNAIGGQGGAGGSGAGGLGGNGGTRSAPAASVGGTKHARALLAYISGRNFTGSSAQVIHGGSGGGSGAGDLANGVAGGAGGGAGGVVGLFASVIAGSGSITADGGVGGSCGAGGNTGGGGGGGGGALYIITTTQSLASVHTLSATGGTGGAKTGTGVAGSNGNDGLVLVTSVSA